MSLPSSCSTSARGRKKTPASAPRASNVASTCPLGNKRTSFDSTSNALGKEPEISASLFAPGYTMASMIANEFTEATTDLYLSALVEVALLLFIIPIMVNAVARLLVWSVARRTPQEVRA